MRGRGKFAGRGRQARTCVCVCTIFLAWAASAEILDRIAVSAGKRVITTADLDREIRITAFQNGDKPDFSPASKRQTAARMVDQRLVRSELEVSRYLLPSPSDADALVSETKSRFPNEAAYRRALAEYGISEEDLKAALMWQLTLVRFIDLRFRPGIQIGDEEIRNYFNDHLRPILEKAHPGQTFSMDDYRAGIDQTLASQAANEQVERWLQEARKRTRIEYHDEAFR